MIPLNVIIFCAIFQLKNRTHIIIITPFPDRYIRIHALRVNTSNTVFALTYIIISNLLKRNNIAFFSTENLAIKLIKFTQKSFTTKFKLVSMVDSQNRLTKYASFF